MFVAVFERFVFYLLILFLPTQLGKHFWPDFSLVSGIRIDYLSPTVYVTDILVGVLFFCWLIRQSYSVKFKNLNLKLQRLTVSFSLLILVLLLNIYLSHNIWSGLYHLLKLLEFSFVGYYVAMTVITFVQFKRIVFFLGIGVIGQSVLAIAQFLKQGSLNGVFYFFGERFFTGSTPGIANASINGELILRPYGTFSHPNVLAGFLLLSMTALLFTFPWTRKFEKGVWITALLFGSSALLLTMSRVAFLLWICLLVIVFLKNISSSSLRTFITVALFGVFIGGLFTTPFGSRFLYTSLTEESFVERIDLMQSSMTLFLKQPLIGIGFGNFIPQLAAIVTPLPLNLYLQPVHNIFLLVLAETGIVGFGIFLWVVSRTYKRLFIIIKQTRGLPYRLFVVLLSLLLILGSFDHYFLTLQQGQLLFSLLLGLAWTSLKE